LHGTGRRCPATRLSASAEFVVVDLITQHDVETDEQAPGEGHLGLGPTASAQDGKVHAFKIDIGAGSKGRGVTEDPAEQRAALLTDPAQSIFISRSVDGRGQADIADHVLAPWETPNGAENEDGGQRS